MSGRDLYDQIRDAMHTRRVHLPPWEKLSGAEKLALEQVAGRTEDKRAA